MMAVDIRRLGPADAGAYRDIRLEGLRRQPECFGTAYGDEAAVPVAALADRLGQAAGIFAAQRDGRLLGIAGLRLPVSPRRAHRGILTGMYVRPEARGLGIADALVQAVLAEARARGLDAVTLTVTAGNRPAQSLYDRHGFLPFALEPGALRFDGRSFDDEQRIRLLP
ncbi:MAG TPA: GNAT family N-acetyltransferase [Inquilinus sp.]|nr:GNAT family N-acetyltransferase [Inquilinus sp.]